MRSSQAFSNFGISLSGASSRNTAGRPVPVEVRDTLELPPLSQQQNPDTPYMQTIRQELGDTPEGRHRFQRCRTLYHQMMMPTVLSKIFPVGLLGLFCLLMVMLLISTDDSRIFNAASTLVQDVVLPFFRRRVESGEHILLLRLMSIGVAVFFFIVSVFFAQIDYIQMYCNIMCSLWTGAAGPIMVFGLYSRFGNLRGAWTAIILGSGTSLSGMILQRTWATSVYPFFERMDWVAGLDRFLRAVSSPFHPWITWSMNPVKFPINSFEIYGLSMVLAIGGYILMSYLTYRPYDLDKLLHRGKYADEFSASLKQEGWSVGRVFRILIGITPEYSRGDKVMAWSVFSYSFVYRFGLCFVVIVIWNLFQPWPHEWWTIKFFITSLAVPGIVGCITTVWFLIGGTYGIFELFRNLEKRKVDPNDNGQILQEK